MEAVSAGAPVLAFIMVALHSTKKVYEAVSDIKNGPDLVEKLAAAVTNLQSVLTQLSNCPAVTSPDPETDLGAILALIKTCSEDVLRYEKQLGKVRTSPDEKGLGRAWKRFMTVLHEKDFQQMSVGVNHHVSALGVHLGLIQSSTASISKRKLVDLNDAISKQAGNDQTQIALLQHQSTDLSIIKDNVNSVTDLSLSIQGQIRETVTPLFQRIEQTAGVSATQYENISVLLQALQHQVSGLVNHSSHLKPVPQSEPQGLVCSGSTDNKGDSKSDHELLNRIERLCQLAKQKEGQKSDNEAEGIIDDLDALLESVSVQLSHSSSEYRPSRKRPIDVVQKEGRNNSRELKRMRSLLTSSDSVLINQKGI
ncbi:hypothetical protein GJ744_004272 [Endocarpon pusillum]|uniref:Azaphilone pigments biosynthesis cluster protein L N-terminal domain-containing protein n=1 Tax=Endocarpon pusillum TaxID=364733 RepID=A0A8H7A5Q1_9EURO|nr:hypothetical protein GJ744_004272 [Endocarpon pusillum]